MRLKVELLKEGYLVRNATSQEEAERAIGPVHAKNVKRWTVGRFRVILPEWREYIDDLEIGSFKGAIGYLEEE